MRIFIVLVVLSALAFAGHVVFGWLASFPPARWHVAPAAATLPPSPNHYLRIGDAAPIVAGTVEEVAARVTEIASRRSAQRIAGAPEDGLVTYVQRTRFWRFPDVVSISLSPTDDGQTRVEIFARARIWWGADYGTNRKRVDAWIAALAP